MTTFWFLFDHNQIILRKTPSGLGFPTGQDLVKTDLAALNGEYVGKLNGAECYAANVPPGFLPKSNWESCLVRKLPSRLAKPLAEFAFRAYHLLTWIYGNRFCGRCGKPMTVLRETDQELSLHCTACGTTSYPRISPAIIVAVVKNQQLLLASSNHFSSPHYSVLAGFVEPGETLEQCVKREVKEEVGLTIKNIRYFASQAWPFPDSLMVAFTAEWENGDICADQEEIVSANWFSADHLPELLPGNESISHQLIDWFIANNTLHGHNLSVVE